MASSQAGQPSESDLLQIKACCQGELHPHAVRGLEHFNAGEYFEAHEELELAWREETGLIRELYRSILQVGVGYYHIQRGNLVGALKVIQRSHRWLDDFPDECRGVNLARLRHDLEKVETFLKTKGLIPPELQKPYFKSIEYRRSSHE